MSEAKSAAPNKAQRQLTLGLPGREPRYDRDAFLISDANEAAWRAVMAWIASSEPALVICGPAGAGKTHLAHIAANELGARVVDASDWTEASANIVIDNMPPIDPKDFLDAFEGAIDEGARLVLAGEGHPGAWPQGLKDLRTRLEALPRASLGEPDEALIRAVIAKGFADRQLQVRPGVIEFAAPRLARTFAAAHGFVAAADAVALEEKRDITRPLVQSVIDKLYES